jgi:hypothetical protein
LGFVYVLSSCSEFVSNDLASEQVGTFFDRYWEGRVMITLIDNTSLHRIFTAIAPHKPSAALRDIDVLALFHFAEHILFSERMELCAFEIPEVNSISAEAIDLLNSRGYTLDDDGESILKMVNFSEDEYAKACEVAAPKIVEDVVNLDVKTLRKCGKFADESAIPLGINSLPTLKWITKESKKIDRVLLKERALSEKAFGSFDYMVCANDTLYEQLRILGSKIRGDRYEIAFALVVFFRTATNQALASQRKAYYSPAPQRARVIHKSDQLFRYALSKRIEQVISSFEGSSPANILRVIQKGETLPLPMFTIHFLRQSKVHNPVEILEAARKLRDNSEVISIRKWLNKWEEHYCSADPSKRNKAIAYLNDVSKELKIDLSGSLPPLYSVLRGDMTVSPTGEMKIKPDFSGMFEYASSLLRPLWRRRIFLAAIANEFAFDSNLGGDIVNMIGRAIIR